VAAVRALTASPPDLAAQSLLLSNKSIFIYIYIYLYICIPDHAVCCSAFIRVESKIGGAAFVFAVCGTSTGKKEQEQEQEIINTGIQFIKTKKRKGVKSLLCDRYTI
jgi:hypothetical protein